MIVGHDRILAKIEKHGVPSVSLFIGPESVGKRRLANQLAQKHCRDPRDVLRIHRLTAELARETASFLCTAPKAQHGLRFAIVNIDDAPKANLNTLLKSLEEMSDYAFIILLATKPPMDTIYSRVQEVYSFALLSENEVEQTLLERGFGKTEAAVRAAESGGQLNSVYNHDEVNKLKSLVLVVLRCFRERDNVGLEALASRWTEEHTALLVKCAHEATTKQWRVFNDAEVDGIPGKVWLAILRALKSDVRPRLVIHAQLAGVLRRIS